MIAKYNDCEYFYIANQRKKEIITSVCSKADASFTHEGAVYFKEVLEGNLSDIYDIEFWVLYDAGFANTPKWWRLDKEKSIITEDGVLLLFTEGALPGWDIIEKNVCANRVNLSEITGARMIRKYIKKGGKVCRPYFIEEKTITVLELLDLHTRYSKTEL